MCLCVGECRWVGGCVCMCMRADCMHASVYLGVVMCVHMHAHACMCVHVYAGIHASVYKQVVMCLQMHAGFFYKITIYQVVLFIYIFS